MWELLIQKCPLVDDYSGGSSAILEGDQWVSSVKESWKIAWPGWPLLAALFAFV